MVCERSVEVECISPEGVGDVFLTVGAQDVEGEAAGSGEYAGVCPDAAGILQHGDITDVVVLVLDAPVAADGLGGLFCAERGGADIKGRFFPAVPHAVLGAACERRSRHLDDARNEPIPRCFFECGTGVENFHDAGLMAHALGVVCGFAALQRCIGLRCALDFPQQAGLIFLNLNKQMALRLKDRLEGFFDSAWRPA